MNSATGVTSAVGRCASMAIRMAYFHGVSLRYILHVFLSRSPSGSDVAGDPAEVPDLTEACVVTVLIHVIQVVSATWIGYAASAKLQSSWGGSGFFGHGIGDNPSLRHRSLR